MSANFEKGMFVREKPWHYDESRKEDYAILADYPTSKEALVASGLDWEVTQHSIQTMDNIIPIDGYVANLRSTDGKVLGVVTDRYKVVQNTEAFEFTDSLIGEGCLYDTAGSLNGGKTIWLLAKMPETEILGDKVEPYMCFTNSHDGKGAIRICMTPIRVVCQNTLNAAFNGAIRSWNTKHMGDMQSKLYEAKHCLSMADNYMKGLNNFAEEMVKKPIYKEDIDKILEQIFPINEEDTKTKKDRVQAMKDGFYYCYMMPDLANFNNTAWGVYNAMVDLVNHCEPKRKSESYRENNWNRIMNGHIVVDKTVEMLLAGTKV